MNAACRVLVVMLCMGCQEEEPVDSCGVVDQQRVTSDQALRIGGTLDELWASLAGPRSGVLEWHEVSGTILGGPPAGTTTTATLELLRWDAGEIADVLLEDLDQSDSISCEGYVLVEGALSMHGEDGVVDDAWNVDLAIEADERAYTRDYVSPTLRHVDLEFGPLGRDEGGLMLLQARWGEAGRAEVQLSYRIDEHRRKGRSRQVASGPVFVWTEDP